MPSSRSPDTVAPTGNSGAATASHDKNFKNLILDYPRQTLEFIAPTEAAGFPADLRILPARQEQLVECLGDRHRETDTPLLLEFPSGEREALVIDIEEETNPARFDLLRMVEYTTGLARLYQTTRVVPVVLFVGPGDATVDIDLGTERGMFLSFRCIACRLASLAAAAYWDTGNLFAALTLPAMRHDPAVHVKVCEQAADRLFELEPDERKRRKYLGFIEREGRLKGPEVLEFRTWLARESRWSDQMMDMFEEVEVKAEAKGRAEGEAKGKADALVRILSRRRVRLTGAQRRQIADCRDLPTLDEWLDRAVTAKTAGEVLGQTRH
jgi:hypothetical protein